MLAKLCSLVSSTIFIYVTQIFFDACSIDQANCFSEENPTESQIEYSFPEIGPTKHSLGVGLQRYRTKKIDLGVKVHTQNKNPVDQKIIMHAKVNSQSLNLKDQRPCELPVCLKLKLSFKEQIRVEIKEADKRSFKPVKVGAVYNQDHPEAQPPEKVRKMIRRRDESKKLNEYRLKEKDDQLNVIKRGTPVSQAVVPAMAPIYCLNSQGEQRYEEQKLAFPP